MLLTWSKYSQDNILNTSVQKHVTFIISHLIFLTVFEKYNLTKDIWWKFNTYAKCNRLIQQNKYEYE